MPAQRVGAGGDEKRHLAARPVLEGARALGGPALRVEDRAALPGREGAADGVALALGEAEDDEAAAGAEGGDLTREEQGLVHEDGECDARLDVGLRREACAPRGAAERLRRERVQLLGAARDAAERRA